MNVSLLLTATYHFYLEPEWLRKHSTLNDFYSILSTNFDRNGREFVSSIEAKRYPFYAVQYHPEKNNFEYGTFPSDQYDIPFESIPHSFEAVTFSFHLATVFVNEARKNLHRYTLPSKFPSVWLYELRRGVAFEQILIIPNTTQVITASNALRGATQKISIYPHRITSEIVSDSE